MANPMKIRAASKDGVTEVKVLMNHEMETGFRKDASGAPMPAWFITEVTAKLNDKVVMEAQWGPSVSKNPYLAFKVKGGAAGRQDRGVLDRQQGRHAHRRSDGELKRTTSLGEDENEHDATRGLAAAAVLAALATTACAETDKSIESIEQYREALRDGNPAELFEALGEEFWKKPAGPNNVSLEKCDLGLGAGVVNGAYAQLPRYFKDTDKVQDGESRLLTCM